MKSPYDGLREEQWRAKTEELLTAHPLDREEIIDITLSCWSAIFETKIGGKAQIGVHIFPRPQIMGTFLHELIPLEFSDRYPGTWRREEEAREKDLVFIPDPAQSVEIKTSSHKSKIFGNRSYAQQQGRTKKTKSGYYLAVNFEKFDRKKLDAQPRILRIRFGWLDGSDWVAQQSSTGQQAWLPPSIYDGKLLLIYSLSRRAVAELFRA